MKVKPYKVTIDCHGYYLDLHNMQVIRQMEEPKNASEQCQYIYFCPWFSTGIPDFHGELRPYNALL